VTLDRAIIGRTAGPGRSSWTASDALLYALAVGAGQDDPTDELDLTTENSEGVGQKILPTYAVVIKQRAPETKMHLGDVGDARIVHAQQEIVLHQPLPITGTAELTSTITEVFDQGSGALVQIETEAIDPGSGAPLFTTRGGMFLRGHGGFGGARAPRREWPVGEQRPDQAITVPVRPEQGLLYRLCGDRNPLHSDPKAAARAGFARPILHGLCTLGIAGRVLTRAVCDGDPARIRSLSGRFTKPVLPGQDLTVSIWSDTDRHLYRVTDSAGEAVIDFGSVTAGAPTR
jgi:acyl dehydratase